MDLGLKGKVTIVTGEASNIGRGITLRFVKEGARVVIAEVDIPQGHCCDSIARGDWITNSMPSARNASACAASN